GPRGRRRTSSRGLDGRREGPLPTRQWTPPEPGAAWAPCWAESSRPHPRKQEATTGQPGPPRSTLYERPTVCSAFELLDGPRGSPLESSMPSFERRSRGSEAGVVRHPPATVREVLVRRFVDLRNGGGPKGSY